MLQTAAVAPAAVVQSFEFEWMWTDAVFIPFLGHTLAKAIPIRWENGSANEVLKRGRAGVHRSTIIEGCNFATRKAQASGAVATLSETPKLLSNGSARSSRP